MDYVDYFEDGEQKRRPCTPEEQAELDERRAGNISPAERNIQIMLKLEALDKKSIRALREGDQSRIDALEMEAASLRLQLVKE